MLGVIADDCSSATAPCQRSDAQRDGGRARCARSHARLRGGGDRRRRARRRHCREAGRHGVLRLGRGRAGDGGDRHFAGDRARSGRVGHGCAARTARPVGRAPSAACRADSIRTDPFDIGHSERLHRTIVLCHNRLAIDRLAGPDSRASLRNALGNAPRNATPWTTTRARRWPPRWRRSKSSSARARS